MASDKILFSELSSFRSYGLMLMVAAPVLIVLSLFIHLQTLAGLLLVIGILTFLAGLALWSLHRYSAITLTKNQLKVGKESLDFKDLDKAFGAKIFEDLPKPDKFAKGGYMIGGKHGDTRIVGGGYGLPLGARWLVLRDRSGKTLLISTWHRDRLKQALQAKLDS